jgi:hypothetical protein
MAVAWEERALSASIADDDWQYFAARVFGSCLHPTHRNREDMRRRLRFLCVLSHALRKLLPSVVFWVDNVTLAMAVCAQVIVSTFFASVPVVGSKLMLATTVALNTETWLEAETNHICTTLRLHSYPSVMLRMDSRTTLIVTSGAQVIVITNPAFETPTYNRPLPTTIANNVHVNFHSGGLLV